MSQIHRLVLLRHWGIGRDTWNLRNPVEERGGEVFNVWRASLSFRSASSTVSAGGRVRVTQCSKTTSLSSTSSFRGTGPSNLTPPPATLTLGSTLRATPMPNAEEEEVDEGWECGRNRNTAPLQGLEAWNAGTGKCMVEYEGDNETVYCSVRKTSKMCGCVFFIHSTCQHLLFVIFSFLAPHLPTFTRASCFICPKN